MAHIYLTSSGILAYIYVLFAHDQCLVSPSPMSRMCYIYVYILHISKSISYTYALLTHDKWLLSLFHVQNGLHVCPTCTSYSHVTKKSCLSLIEWQHYMSVLVGLLHVCPCWPILQDSRLFLMSRMHYTFISNCNIPNDTNLSLTSRMGYIHGIHPWDTSMSYAHMANVLSLSLSCQDMSNALHLTRYI